MCYLEVVFGLRMMRKEIALSRATSYSYLGSDDFQLSFFSI